MKKFLLIFSGLITVMTIQMAFDDKFFIPKLSCKFGNESACSKINIAGNKYMLNSKFDEAEELLSTACKAKFYKACSNLGALYDKKAEFYSTLSCENGFFGACSNLAIAYMRTYNYDKAIPLFEIACDNEIAKSCAILGYMYSIGNNGVRKDYKKAIEFYDKACKIDPRENCENAKELSRYFLQNSNKFRTK